MHDSRFITSSTKENGNMNDDLQRFGINSYGILQKLNSFTILKN